VILLELLERLFPRLDTAPSGQRTLYTYHNSYTKMRVSQASVLGRRKEELTSWQFICHPAALANLLCHFSRVYSQQIILEDRHVPTVSFEETGLSHLDLNQTVALALGTCQVREILNNTRHRLLFSELTSAGTLYRDIKDESEMFQATVYDYTRGRNILVRGIPFDPTTFNIAETNNQPYPSAEEIEEAAQLAGINSHEHAAISMPPFITNDFANGTSHRLLHLVITSPSSSRLVYVNMNNGTVEKDISQALLKNKMVCNAPGSSDQSTVKASPGTANLVIKQNGKVLWTLQVIRPAASSGMNGGGIELRDVKYKGKSVLYQASVPILNVEYEDKSPGCGPYYRDWQKEEYPLHCSPNIDFYPWLRLCKTPATTIVDPPHIDGGDFTGVAVSIEGQEVVLKSQMLAGWYRYTSEWRFHVDGTLKPRWGFGGVLQGKNCICRVHHHHVYWRLDFDIVSAGNNIVREFNKPPIFPGQNYHDKIYEIKRPKDSSRSRHWEVSGRTGETYGLFPGSNDGASDNFGVGDLWVLKYHSNELDDGVPFVMDFSARANIDKFVNGEPVKDKDVVLWYGAHFTHDQSHEGGGDHVVGPDIRPLKW
jgi:hypothetical protein